MKFSRTYFLTVSDFYNIKIKDAIKMVIVIDILSKLLLS